MISRFLASRNQKGIKMVRHIPIIPRRKTVEGIYKLFHNTRASNFGADESAPAQRLIGGRFDHATSVTNWAARPCQTMI